MKKKKTVGNFTAHKYIEKLIKKWRQILGVDSVYVIQFIESPEDTGYPAWVDGLSPDNPHPTANIFINSAWLQKNKDNEEKIIELIIHELLHIIVYHAFIMIDPNYKYKGLKAFANEVLVMKITKAIIIAHSID